MGVVVTLAFCLSFVFKTFLSFIQDEDNNGLSLLLMESDDDKDHFDYKDIVKRESKKDKKRKKKKRAADDAAEDNFKMDLGDERFSAIFKKAEYNVDPSNPNFKKTKSMQSVIEEKQRRLQSGGGSLKQPPTPSSSSDPPPEKRKKLSPSSSITPTSTSTLDQLVHAVKAKSNRMAKSKKK